MESLTVQDWRRLVETIQRGTCVLLLGPGVAVDERHPQRLPLQALLAQSLLAQQGGNATDEPPDFRHIAQMFLAREGADRIDLEMSIRDFYAPYASRTTELHRLIAQLPFHLCVSTTHDQFLANAFVEKRKKPQCCYYGFRKPSAVSGINPGPRSPMVFNLYGDLSDADSLVLTENDLLDFLVSVVKDKPPLPSAVTARFSAADTSFLFLGFGFHRWYVRILLHVLQSSRHRYSSFALEDAGFFSHPERPQTAVFFEREHLIRFKLLSWQSFVRELAEQVNSASTESIGAAAQEQEASKDAPLVFLCHAHEDREAVAALAERLQRAELRVWLDKQSLRGGDNWDRLIRDVIGKHVDYVVVLQSSHMHAQVRSYVFQEITLALQTQAQFARDVRFVIPTCLDGCKPLAELAQLHLVDLHVEGGFEALTRAILEDWSNRQSSKVSLRNAS